MIKQVNEKAKPFQKANTPRPAKGWVNAIRLALGMTTKELGERLHVSQPRISELEAAETKDAITLKSLRAAANAMNCDLVYAIVPRAKSIEGAFLEQAKKIAKKRVMDIQHTMELEGQGLNKKQLDEHYKATLEILLRGNPKQVWEDE